MSYTKVGPFTDGVPPYLNASFFNGVETALAVATPTTASSMSVASGASFGIVVPGFSGGTLTIYGTAGGAWSSVWTGVYAADSARVDVTQIATDFTTPGQLITSVTGSATGTTITVATAASGNTASFWYSINRAGGG